MPTLDAGDFRKPIKLKVPKQAPKKTTKKATGKKGK